MCKRLEKSGSENFILTPKYDGCSLRIYITKNDYKCLNRTDVDFGYDITSKTKNLVKDIIPIS